MNSLASSFKPAHWALRLRNRHFLLLDALVLCVTPALALMLRVDGVQALSKNAPALLFYIVVALFIRLGIFYVGALYSRYWRYASIDEMVSIVMAVLISTIAIALVFFVLRTPAFKVCSTWPAACGLPRSVPFIDGLLVILGIGLLRFSVRTADLYLQRGRAGQPTQRVLIMGAGEAGAMIAREMSANPQLGLDPIGFVDDDASKLAMHIRNLPVLGDRLKLPALVATHRIDEVIIAMPTAPGKSIREVVAICKEAGVPAKIMPGIFELLGGQVSVNQLRSVEIEDLLRRDAIQTDIAAVRQLLQGRCVLVTGGGGSIGSELCRQILRCKPAQLVIVGHGENSVFEIQQELQREQIATAAHGQVNSSQRVPKPEVIALIADIRFEDRIQRIFQRYRPQIVFHAAAHKHLPLMEENPSEAITNNVLGTRHVLNAALAAEVERFVLISTDKAVNPTSVMGASKRTAELLVHEAAQRSGRPYVAVRFGNVLGSRGSVVLTFKQQIAAGGPVTVTHPDMTRFFMTIPEAVQLVLQAAVLGKGSAAFVLDMGEPVKIVDLAEDLIRLSGLEVGRDIDIVFTGLRQGEKLYEELFIASEDYQRTAHQKIFLAPHASAMIQPTLQTLVDELIAAAHNEDEAAIRQQLTRLIPEYCPPEPAPAMPPSNANPLLIPQLPKLSYPKRKQSHISTP